MGIAATAAAKQLSHTIQFGVTLALITNLAQYVLHKCFTRPPFSHWQQFGPFYICALGVPLIMADLTRHILQDSDVWPSPGSDMYRSDCKYSTHGIGGLRCLSWVGLTFTILATYSGFACLIWGMLWATDIHKKLSAAWSVIRRS
mmetsp:Transcript_5129/g.14338  ORF Transcript_5129/g.14338 Transcript_5129/m.14338 type:complete len:145 (-) Transcript_5129:175-609(-)